MLDSVQNKFQKTNPGLLRKLTSMFGSYRFKEKRPVFLMYLKTGYSSSE